MTYLITFACYGAWLPGEEGAVDRNHNIPGRPLPAADAGRVQAVEKLMKQEPYLLDEAHRNAVLNVVQEVCRFRNWTLLAAHVRRWARHGSTRYLWTTEEVSAAISYVVSRQGDPLAVFELKR
ncbi:MAG: hypothetical protein WD696_04345 [Bryobacteraceae bacterium]